MLTIASLGKGPTVYFGTFRVSVLIENVAGPKTLGDLYPLFISLVVAETKVSHETAFLSNWVTRLILWLFSAKS